MDAFYKIIGKRCLDVLVSFVGLVIFAPIFAVVTLCIYITDGTPIFFRQTRMGASMRPFSILKFRSMSTAKNSVQFELGATHRVTGIGRVLRKTKLDELPQLVNVLKGDMTLVGPRPEVPKWVDEYPDRWKVVLNVRPGITDPASIAYRNEEQLLSNAVNPESMYREEILPRKLDYYESYVSDITFKRDIVILLDTLKVIARW